VSVAIVIWLGEGQPRNCDKEVTVFCILSIPALWPLQLLIQCLPEVFPWV